MIGSSYDELRMFVRFVCNKSHPNIVGAELGMFTARDRIDFSSQKGSVQKAHEEAWYWFHPNGGGGLRYPHLKGKVRTPEIRKSLFWFKKDATFSFTDRSAGKVVDRAQELASALTLAGCEIRKIEVKNPGQILWEDSNQVLAFADPAEIPNAF